MIFSLSLWLGLACAPQEISTPWVGFPEADALKYEIQVEVDFEEERVKGGVQYHFLASQDLDVVRLHFKDGAKWSVSFSSEAGLPLAWSRADAHTIQVALSEPIKQGDEFSFQGHFQGVPPDGLFFRDNRRGKRVAFTDHFAARARGWLPCEDSPDDRAHFNLELKARGMKGLDAIGTGDWHSVNLPEGETAEGWSAWAGNTQAEITSYLFSFAVGPYSRISEQGDERFVPHYVFRADMPKARRGLKHHGSWMQAMESLFGPYAWAKYCVVQVPTQWGGMENPGNTWVMERLFDGTDHGVGTLAHEFVHQWFGDAVGYGSWQDAWLSEGFATYLGPWLHELAGGPPLSRAMTSAKRRWLNARTARSRPIRWDGFESPDELFGSSAPNTYQKAAWVLHMLRQEVGEEAFFQALAAYVEKMRGLPAKTSDLVSAMESAAGRDLDWFFTQWLDRPGCPELYFEWNGKGVRVSQMQGELPFVFPIRFSWVNDQGQSQSQVFRMEGEEAFFELPVGYRVPKIDPQSELLWVKARLR